jgi:hypothetical protein
VLVAVVLVFLATAVALVVVALEPSTVALAMELVQRLVQ